MKIKELLRHLEHIAPPFYQESYDNAGLIVGDSAAACTGALLCLDSTEAVIEEAIRKNCNLVIAHHPIVFRGLKKITGKNYVERTVLKAIKNDVAIYAIHTNLDNVFRKGVNQKFAERLGLTDLQILAPKQVLKKLVTWTTGEQAETLQQTLLDGGAFQPNIIRTDAASPIRLEMIFPEVAKNAVMEALFKNHPAGQPVFDILPTENVYPEIGSGMLGSLQMPVSEEDFLKMVKKQMRAGCVRHTQLLGRQVSKVAICGGSGGFLLPNAIAAGADVFITADYKYHEFFDADGKIVIADIGHYESEQFTIQLLFDILSEKFPTFALHLTEVNTNPVRYL